jgi:hypothetical protein
MIIIALFIVFLLGLSIINTISKEFTTLEKIGASFLIGIGAETIFMFILDVLGIRFTGSLLIVMSIICIILMNFKNIIHYKEWISSKKLSLPKIGIKDVDLTWVFFFVLTCYLVYASVAKSLYWPTYAYDNVAGYDLMGKVMAEEGKISNSLFNNDGKPINGLSNRVKYPPLVAGSFAFAYLFNLEMSKIMTSLFFIFYAILFYATLRQCTTKKSSIIFTFFAIISPEFFAFTSLSTTNIPTAIYATFGMIYLFFWVDKRDIKYLLISAIFMGLITWSRNDSVTFSIVGVFILIYYSIKNKTLKELIIFISIAFIPFVSWTLYGKFKIDISQNVFFDRIDLDYSRAIFILDWIKNLILNTSLYGITFYAFAIAIVLNINKIFNDNATKLLVIILLSWILYSAVYYQLDPVKMGSSLDKIMQASYKRGLFAFIPVIWFYVAVNQLMTRLFRKVDNTSKVDL